jgi:hypothetical protein
VGGIFVETSLPPPHSLIPFSSHLCQVQGHHAGHVHMERHERAVHVQRARGDVPEGRASPRRRRAPPAAQPVRQPAAPGHLPGPAAARRQPHAALRPHALHVRGVAALGRRLDGRQQGRLGPPQGLHPHVPLLRRGGHGLLRLGRGRLLRQPGRRAHGPLVPGCRLPALLQVSHTHRIPMQGN